MKTKLSALLTACFMLFSICTKAQTTVQDRQAMAMLKEFYTAYMTEMAGTTGSEKELDALKKKYCTAKLIRNIPKLGEKDDCDPIIKAQDSNTENVKTLSVKKDNTKPNTYAISYADTDFFSKKITVINIHASVVKQADGFKMDNVW